MKEVETYIGIELTNKAREIAVLEESGKEIPGKLRRLPHDKGGAGGVPRHDVVGRRILHQHVCLQQERWWVGFPTCIFQQLFIILHNILHT